MTTDHTRTTDPTPSLDPPRTSVLLAGAAMAGPLWACVSLAQAGTREGFTLLRHPLSALSTGEMGWLQITNFVVAGVLIVGGAVGLRRVLAGAPGGTWAPRLVAVYGAGMVAAGVLVMDPADGFPVGTPAGPPNSLSWHAGGHLAAGAISFTALAVACLVLRRYFGHRGQRGLSVVSLVAGVAVPLGNGWAMTGGPAGSLTLAAGVIPAMLWLSTTAWLLRRELRHRTQSRRPNDTTDDREHP
ncbi:DUF998 domain-containing protein [Spiractinospora alimapuensis]|uniref:DUF998 domain-containing protein n=1 Tax=Spiractinospora alimapuensis TaxID=2820884 RepID=UPI001F1CF588|nr:DUF998 domain-containing protein [Spiractinospora alimapuensis]QVQ50206.1 DUF998 domain-containing protein [Spiractinospora alimapuensis]